MHSRDSRDQGFSFVELLAYMAIAALLILAAVPQFDQARMRAYDTTVRSDVHNIATAIEASYSDAGAYPFSEDALRSLGLVATKASYRPSGSTIWSGSLLVCSTGDSFGVVGQSKSQRIFGYSQANGVHRVNRGNDNGAALLCSNVGADYATQGGGYTWLMSYGRQSAGGWSSAVR